MHTKVTKKDAAKGEHACACGGTFKTRFRLGRHVQKWNAKHDLRDRRA